MDKERKTSAIATLCELRNGRTVAELDEAMAQLVEAVRGTNKPGRLTLTLTVKPFSKGRTDDEVQVMSLEDAIALKLPQLEKGATVFYADPGGALARNDPRQLTLDDLKIPTTPEPPAAPAPGVANIADRRKEA